FTVAQKFRPLNATGSKARSCTATSCAAELPLEWPAHRDRPAQCPGWRLRPGRKERSRSYGLVLNDDVAAFGRAFGGNPDRSAYISKAEAGASQRPPKPCSKPSVSKPSARGCCRSAAARSA